jgi:putative transposase
LTVGGRSGTAQPMARKLRIEYPGAIYHVLNRGDRREDIFQADSDREQFLATLGEACLKTDWQVHAYCLMVNHFHLVLETPKGNLVAGMKWFLGTYTARFNRAHDLSGHLFSGRYKALLVDARDRGYMATACEYVHLNPARAGLLRREDPLRSFRWSSYPAYLAPPARRPVWLRVDRVLGECGIQRDDAEGRKRFERIMEERRRSELPQQYEQIRQGWYIGSEAFRQGLLVQVEDRQREAHYGEELSESDEAKAERLIEEGLKKLDWSERQLADEAKCHPAKVRLATTLRAETTMTLKWIAARLHMGTWTNLSTLLSKQRQKLQ